MRRRFLSLAFVLSMSASSNGVSGQTAVKQETHPAKTIAPVRRVVTGTNAEGKSTVIFDGPNPTVLPRPRGVGGGFDVFWVTDKIPVDNSGNTDSTIGLKTNAAPKPNGSSFHLIEWEPGEGLKNDSSERSSKDPMMHKTPTIEYVVILSGAINMRMEDSSEVQLKVGDVLVQRGAAHKWINRGTVPCRAAITQIVAVPTKD